MKPSNQIDSLFAKSLLQAYNTKAADSEKSRTKARSRGPETRMILILSVFDDRSVKWTYELLVEQQVFHQEPDPRKKANQIRKISGWISKIRVQEMQLPPLCKGLVQPPDMAVARQRWDALNPRPSDEMILSGEWKGIAADYSDLDLAPRQLLGKSRRKGKDSSPKRNPEERCLFDPASNGNPSAKDGGSETVPEASGTKELEAPPMNQIMQRMADENDKGAPLVVPKKKSSLRASAPINFKS